MIKKESRWAFMSRKVIGPSDNPMLVRWRIIQTPLGGLYLHLIYREDLDRYPHDHPWTFWSWVIRGSYTEEYYADSRLTKYNDLLKTREIRSRWSLRRFPKCAAHRIITVMPYTTSLVLVGRKTRTWGFYTPTGTFVDWRDYHLIAK